MIFLGLDIGSTGCKCVAFREDGTQTAKCYVEYQTAAGSGDMDPEAMCRAAETVIGGCAEKAGAAEVVSIAVTSFGESIVAVSADGRALSPMLMYTDKRGIEENARLVEIFGMERLTRTLCLRPDAMFSLPKIMWLLKNHPNVREKVWKFMQPTDFICFRLTGRCCVNETLACRTMAYDVEARCWDEAILNAAGITVSHMPEPVPCGSVIGELSSAAASRLGLSPTVKVITASQDQIAAAVGAGVLKTGEAVDGTGTVECITPVFDHIIRDPGFSAHNYICVPHMSPGKYSTYAFCFAGGATLKWFRDCFAGHLKVPAAARGVSVYRMLDESCPDTPSDILVLPHFLGAGATPDMIPSAKGTITGLTMAATLSDIYRAVLEGITFEMTYNLHTLEDFGIHIHSLRATGGGAASPAWLQIKADIMGRPITPVKADEAGTVGCAMVSAIQCGVFSSLEEAARQFVTYGDTYYPNENLHDFYAEKYSRYLDARAGLLHIWENSNTRL